MRRRSIEMPDERLEAVLRDVGAHLALDVPATATATATGTATERPAMVTTVLARIAELDNHDVRDPAGSRPPRRRFGGERRRSLVLVGAGAVVVVALVLAITPTRDAVAGWFGIGAVRITTTDPGTPGGAGPRAEASTPPTLSPESSP